MKRIGIARSRYDVCQGNKITEPYRGTSSRDDTQYSEAVLSDLRITLKNGFGKSSLFVLSANG